MDTNTIIILAAGVNIITVLGVGWRLARFIARIELKVDTMWHHYLRQTSE